MKKTNRTVTALLLGATALSLAACSGDDPAPAAQYQPPAATPSAPAEASATDEAETPEEFISRWFQVADDMQNSGNTTEYLAMAPSCTSCKELADRVTAIYAAGGRIQLGGSTVGTVTAYKDTGDTFVVPVQSGPTTFKADGTASAQSSNGSSATLLVTLARAGDGWAVTKVKPAG